MCACLFTVVCVSVYRCVRVCLPLSVYLLTVVCVSVYRCVRVCLPFSAYLFTVMRNGLQDSLQRGDSNGHVYKMSGVEEIVQVTEQGERQVPQVVQERLCGKGNICNKL